MAKKRTQQHEIGTIAGARLVQWSVKRSGYCVRVLDSAGETVREFKTRFTRGRGRICDPCTPEANERIAREAAEAIARQLGVVFVCRGDFRWRWFDPDAEPTPPVQKIPNEPSTPLVYAAIDDSLVFLEPQQAEELATCQVQWNRQQTWGALKANLPPDQYRELARLFDGDQPDENSLIDTRDFDPYSDGRWPDWPAQQMVTWVPDDIIRRFGRVEDSLQNGKCLTLPADQEAEIVAAFLRLGYECRRDDTLVRRACGYVD